MNVVTNAAARMPFILLAPIAAPTPVPQTISPRSDRPDTMAAATFARNVRKVDRLRIVGSDVVDRVTGALQERHELALHGETGVIRSDHDLHGGLLSRFVGRDPGSGGAIRH